MPSRSKKDPDIYLIVIDALRADHVSCFNENAETITANIDEWVNECEIFVNMMSCSNHTYPSFASLLAGKYPSKLGARLTSKISKAEKTIPAFLKERGYKSVNYSVLRNVRNLTKDFDQNINLPWRKLMGIPKPRTTFKSLDARLASMLEYLSYLGRMYNLFPTASSEDLFKILRSFGLEEPVMLLFHFVDLHSPYHPPRRYWRKSVSARDYLKVRNFNLSHWNNVINSKLLDEASRQILLKLYKYEIMYVDELLGRFIQYLKKAGKYDDALIIITADHGESFGDHNMLGHWHVLYEDVLHVPLIIKWPGSERQGVNNVLVQTVDIVPTILDYLGIQASTHLDGMSLNSGDIQEDRIGIAEQLDSPAELYGSRKSFDEWNRKMPEFNYKAVALRQRNYKFISYSNGKAELFNLDEDSGELNDLSKEEYGVLNSFSGLCKELYDTGVISRSWESAEEERIRLSIKKLKLRAKI